MEVGLVLRVSTITKINMKYLLFSCGLQGVEKEYFEIEFGVKDGAGELKIE